MRHHTWAVGLSACITFVFSLPAAAATLIEDFNAGIPSGRWNLFTLNAADAPWTVVAPDTSGSLRVQKAADSDFSTGWNQVRATLDSRFEIAGNFSAWVDFTLHDLPLPANGYNTIGIIAAPDLQPNPRGDDPPTGGIGLCSLRFAAADGQFIEGYGYNGPFGMTADSTISGRLGITRAGETMQAWIDRGSGPVLIGGVTSPELLGPMNLRLFAGQNPAGYNGRPRTAFDVSFDNVTITADVITPEPATLSLLAIGGFAMMRRWRRAA